MVYLTKRKGRDKAVGSELRDRGSTPRSTASRPGLGSIQTPHYPIGTGNWRWNGQNIKLTAHQLVRRYRIRGGGEASRRQCVFMKWCSNYAQQQLYLAFSITEPKWKLRPKMLWETYTNFHQHYSYNYTVYKISVSTLKPRSLTPADMMEGNITCFTF
jgi:hypothetical protein